MIWIVFWLIILLITLWLEIDFVMLICGWRYRWFLGWLFYCTDGDTSLSRFAHLSGHKVSLKFGERVEIYEVSFSLVIGSTGATPTLFCFFCSTFVYILLVYILATKKLWFGDIWRPSKTFESHFWRPSKTIVNFENFYIFLHFKLIMIKLN